MSLVIKIVVQIPGKSGGEPRKESEKTRKQTMEEKNPGTDVIFIDI